MALRHDDTRLEGGDTSSHEPEVINVDRGTGVTALLLAASVFAVLFIIFLAQSTDSVPVEFLVWEGEAPLFVVLLATMAATALTTLALAGVWRRRRRRSRSEREELQRLRARNG